MLYTVEEILVQCFWNCFQLQDQVSANLRMSPSKKKVAKPTEVSLVSSPKVELKDELPKDELPKDENKLFDEDDNIGTSTLSGLSITSEEKDKPSIRLRWVKS